MNRQTLALSSEQKLLQAAVKFGGPAKLIQAVAEFAGWPSGLLEPIKFGGVG